MISKMKTTSDLKPKRWLVVLVTCKTILNCTCATALIAILKATENYAGSRSFERVDRNGVTATLKAYPVGFGPTWIRSLWFRQLSAIVQVVHLAHIG